MKCPFCKKQTVSIPKSMGIEEKYSCPCVEFPMSKKDIEDIVIEHQQRLDKVLSRFNANNEVVLFEQINCNHKIKYDESKGFYQIVDLIKGKTIDTFISTLISLDTVGCLLKDLDNDQTI